MIGVATGGMTREVTSERIADTSGVAIGYNRLVTFERRSSTIVPTGFRIAVSAGWIRDTIGEASEINPDSTGCNRLSIGVKTPVI